MHDSSYRKMALFCDAYLEEHRDSELDILDFGSQEVASQPNSSYRQLFRGPLWRYRGLDVVAGENVDLVVANPFEWTEVQSDSVDLVVSGQTFEHIDYFWISAFEIGRVLRPGGIAAIIAPSSGAEHRYPLDCWRYYPDGLAALAQYIGFKVLEVGTDWHANPWADSMLVMQKPLWSKQERLSFHLSLAHQRAVTSPGGFKKPKVETSLPEPSVFRELHGGNLSKIFSTASPQVAAPPPVRVLGALAARVRARFMP